MHAYVRQKNKLQHSGMEMLQLHLTCMQRHHLGYT